MRTAKRLFLALLGLGWVTAAGRATVFVVEVPGASGKEFEQLQAASEFPAGGGIARFLEQGRAVPGLRVSNPTLPSFGRRALLSGERLAKEISTWDASANPPSPSHLLLELSRNGGRVGAVQWPGLEGLPAEAQPEWGLPDQETQEYPARLQLVLERDWTDEKYGVGPGPSRLWGLPPTVQSFSPPLTVGFPFLRPHEFAKQRLDLVAIDRTDDGVRNYDAVLVSTDRDPQKGFVGLLEPGRWLEFPLPTQGPDRRAVPQWARLRLLELDPELRRMLVYAAPVAFVRPRPSRLLELLGGSSWIWPGRPEGEVLLGEAFTRFDRGVDAFAESVERFASEAFRAAVLGAREFRTDLVLVSLPVFASLNRYTPPFEVATRPREAQLRREVWQAMDRALARFLSGLDPTRDRVFVVSTFSPGLAHHQVDLWQLWKPVLGGKALPGTLSLEGGALGIRLHVVGRDPDGRLKPGEARKLLRELERPLRSLKDGFEAVFPAVQAGLAKGPGWDLVAFVREGYQPVEFGPGTGVVQKVAQPQWIAGVAVESSPVQGLLLEWGKGVQPSRAVQAPSLEEVHRQLREALGLRGIPSKR